MKIILVTGVAGFLGSHVADHLLRAGHTVVGIDNLQGGYEENVPPGVRFFKMDIRDQSAVNRLFSHIKFKAVIHCAAFAAENLSHNCRIHTYQSVVLGSAVMVNAAINHGVEVFVSMSSIAIYGHQTPPFSEKTPAFPCDPYGAARTCMEADLRAATAQFGMPHLIFRPHNIIGVRQNIADRTRNVASIFVRQALTKRPFTIFGDGQQTRGFSPVSKVASIIAASVDRPETWNNTLNIGGDRVMSVMRLACVVAERAGVDVEVQYFPERNEAKHAHSDHTEVKRVFGDLAEAPESIEDTIGEMIDEARRIPMRPLLPLPGIEIQKNLNPAWTSQL